MFPFPFPGFIDIGGGRDEPVGFGPMTRAAAFLRGQRHSRYCLTIAYGPGASPRSMPWALPLPLPWAVPWSAMRLS